MPLSYTDLILFRQLPLSVIAFSDLWTVLVKAQDSVVGKLLGFFIVNIRGGSSVASVCRLSAMSQTSRASRDIKGFRC